MHYILISEKHQTRDKTMAYNFGKFIWHEVHTNDLEKSRAYYTEVLGWTAEEMPGMSRSVLIIEAAVG